MTAVYDRLITSGLIFLILFTPVAHAAADPWSIALFEITACLMALLLIFKMLSLGKIEFVRNPFSGLSILFISYVFLQLILSTRSPQPTTMSLPVTVYPWATKTELLKIISYVLIFFAALNTVKTRRGITGILAVIIGTGLIMSIAYLVRYFGGQAPRGFLNPDHFASYLGMIVPLALGFLFMSPQTMRHAPAAAYALKIALLFCVTVMSCAVFFTMSRGGAISFTAALLCMTVLALMRRSTRSMGWILPVAVLCSIASVIWLGAAPVVKNLASIKTEIISLSFSNRMPVWKGTVHIIKEYPLFGTGLGTFNYIFPKYQPAEVMAQHYTYAHSDVLELLSETGIIGFMVAAVCGLWTFGWLFRRFRERHNRWVTGLSIGMFGSLASISVHSFADFSLHKPANAILLCIIVSLFMAILNAERRPETGHGSPVRAVRIPRRANIIVYPVAVACAGSFIIACARPAVADYLYQRAIVAHQPRPQGAGRAGTAKIEDLQERIFFLKMSIKLDPTNAAYYYQLGKLSLEKAKPDLQDTIAAYEKAIALNPNESRYRQSLAWASGRLAGSGQAVSKKKEAESAKPAGAKSVHETFQEAISLEPNSPYRHRAYAIWLFNHPTEENIKKGIAEYQKAVELEPALAEEAMTEYYQRQRDCGKLVSILPESEENDLKIFRFVVEKEGLRFAVKYAQESLKTYPYNADIHFWIADRSFYDKDFSWEFTKKHYERAFELDPDNADYRKWRGIHLYYRQEYENALKDLEASIAMGLDPEGEEQVREYMEKCKSNIYAAYHAGSNEAGQR